MRTTSVVTALIASLALAAPSSAATIGATGGGAGACAGQYEYGDSAASVPAGGGRVTQLSFAQGALNLGDRVALNVLAPNADGSYTVVGGTGVQELDGTPGVRTFAVDIPVTGGEILGLYVDSVILSNCLREAADVLPIAYLGAPPTDGTTFFIDETDDRFALNLSATLQRGPTAAGRGTEGDPVLAPQRFTGALADVTGTDLSATIDWGDGTSSTGEVRDGVVLGNHTFAATGPYVPVVHVTDGDGETADATTHLLVYGSTPGSFVVGDRSAAGDVVFAGPQWARANALSDGPVSPAFKGYATGGTAACGATLAARPGNAMPTSVPAYLAVAVTDAVARSGPGFSAEVRRVVIVRADPAAPGTGRVVATLCG